MKPFKKIGAVLAAIALTACTTTNPSAENSTVVTQESRKDAKVLVAYYSATGTTESVATTIAEAVNADTFQIEPVNPYTSEDLDWTNSQSRVSIEHDNPEERDVELVSTEVENWDEYEVVYIGYPIWWQNASWVVDNFVKDNDFTGKTVIPFATSQSSSFGKSGENLAKLTTTGNWIDGARFSRSSTDEEIQNWANSSWN